MGNTTFTKTVVSSVAWLSAANSGGNGIVKLETSSDNVGIGTATPGEKLSVVGDISASGDLHSGGNILADSYIKHAGDANTYIYFTDDDINFTVGGINMLDFTEDTNDEITFNEGAADLDVRIEGEADPNLLFTDASTSRVGIGTSAPVHKLTVAGSISALGNIYLSSGPVGTGGSSSTTVSGGIALVGTTVHLADPVSLTQIAEADAVAADKMLIWDESVSAWKYITIEDLQDEIDTGSGSGEANENSFKTFSVSARDTTIPHQSDIIADTSTDTFILCAGPNVELIADSATDSITISARDTVGSGGGGGMSNFYLEDGDGTEVTVSDGKEVKFVEGGGIDIDWTDTDNGTDADPYDLTFTINAAQTGITSLLATDIKIGEDDQTKIDFETNDEIHFYAANVHQVKLIDNAFTPQADSDVDLGASGTYWKDGYIDTVTTTGNVTVGASLSAKTTLKGQIPCEIGIAASDETSNLTTGTAKTTFRMPHAMTLTSVRANVNTAPVGSTIIVDINEGGSTILSTKLSIDASEKTSTTAAAAAVISDSALADDGEITIDIDQIGSSTAGKGLKVWLIGTRRI